MNQFWLGVCQLVGGVILASCAFIPVDQSPAIAQERAYWQGEYTPVSAPVPFANLLLIGGVCVGIKGLWDIAKGMPDEDPRVQSVPGPVLMPTSQPARSFPAPTLKTPQETLVQQEPVAVQQPQAVVQQKRDRLSGEFEWIKELIEYPAVKIYGAQGGGKTSKAGFLVAEHLKKGDRVEIADPLAKAGMWKGLKVYGRGENYVEVAQGLSAFTKEASRRLQKRGIVEGYDPLLHEQGWFLVCDEMTDWEDGVDPKVMKDFISACTQKLRQAGMGVIFISHGDTQATGGGAKANRGKSKTMDITFRKLEVTSVSDPSVPGGLRCSGQAFLYIPYKEKQTVIVPRWMQPPAKYNFAALLPQQEAKEEAIAPSKEDLDLAKQAAARAAEFNIQIDEDYWK